MAAFSGHSDNLNGRVRLDSVFAIGRRTEDVQMQSVSSLHEAFDDELPAPILFYPNSLWGINKRVVGWNVGPYNTYQARPWVKDTFVTDGK